jgi:hypothetical protein
VRLDARPRTRPQRRRIALAAYLGSGPSFDRAAVEFANSYAEQNERDYHALAAAAKSGEVPVQTGL